MAHHEVHRHVHVQQARQENHGIRHRVEQLGPLPSPQTTQCQHPYEAHRVEERQPHAFLTLGARLTHHVAARSRVHGGRGQSKGRSMTSAEYDRVCRRIQKTILELCRACAGVGTWRKARERLHLRLADFSKAMKHAQINELQAGDNECVSVAIATNGPRRMLEQSRQGQDSA